MDGAGTCGWRRRWGCHWKLSESSTWQAVAWMAAMMEVGAMALASARSFFPMSPEGHLWYLNDRDSRAPPTLSNTHSCREHERAFVHRV
jgi:hypothetical protein